MIAKKLATKKYDLVAIKDFLNSPDTEATLANNRKCSKYFYKAYVHYHFLMWTSCILALLYCILQKTNTEYYQFTTLFFLFVSVFCFIMHRVSYKKHTYYGRMNEFLFSTIEHMKQTLLINNS